MVICFFRPEFLKILMGDTENTHKIKEFLWEFEEFLNNSVVICFFFGRNSNFGGIKYKVFCFVLNQTINIICHRSISWSIRNRLIWSFLSFSQRNISLKNPATFPSNNLIYVLYTSNLIMIMIAFWLVSVIVSTI